MEKVRIGILGAGSIAKRHIEAMKEIENIEIAGITGARPGSLERVAAEFGINMFNEHDMLINNADAIDICLPTFMHESMTRLAAVLGIHVLCEKPIALDPFEAKQMVDTCEKAGVKFMVAHCLRFWPEYVFIKDLIERKKYGGLVDFSSWRYGPLPDWASRNWLMDAKLSGGPGIDLHIHDIDMIRFLMGEPCSVYSGRVEKEKVISANSEFRFDGGATARAAAGWYISPEYVFTQGYRATFENAVVTYHSDHEPAMTVSTSDGRTNNRVIEQTDPYREQMAYFADCIIDDIEPERCSGSEGLKTLMATLAAGESAACGEIVKLPYNPDSEEE